MSARGWPQEAALRMLCNNLDPAVAVDQQVPPVPGQPPRLHPRRVPVDPVQALHGVRVDRGEPHVTRLPVASCIEAYILWCRA